MSLQTVYCSHYHSSVFQGLVDHFLHNVGTIPKQAQLLKHYGMAPATPGALDGLHLKPHGGGNAGGVGRGNAKKDAAMQRMGSMDNSVSMHDDMPDGTMGHGGGRADGGHSAEQMNEHRQRMFEHKMQQQQQQQRQYSGQQQPGSPE